MFIRSTSPPVTWLVLENHKPIRSRSIDVGGAGWPLWPTIVRHFAGVATEGHPYNDFRLIGEADAGHEIFEARVVADGAELRTHLQPNEPLVPLVIKLLE